MSPRPLWLYLAAAGLAAGSAAAVRPAPPCGVTTDPPLDPADPVGQFPQTAAEARAGWRDTEADKVRWRVAYEGHKHLVQCGACGYDAAGVSWLAERVGYATFRRDAWDQLDDAKNPHLTPERRERAAERLRELIGADDYAAGVMP